MIRSRIPKPRSNRNPSKEYVYYTSSDLYVGAIVNFNEHTFLLTEADDYVFAFMEKYEERENVRTCVLRFLCNCASFFLGSPVKIWH